LYNGFGNTLARAFELVVTPALFAVIGHFIDRAAGTHFIFTLALTVFCLIGMSIRMVYGYIETMKVHEEEAVWNRQHKVTSKVPSSTAASGVGAPALAEEAGLGPRRGYRQ
jgi:hypothetical protein